MKIIDNRIEKKREKLDLTPGSIIEDESGIWRIHVNDDNSKSLSCIRSYFNEWLTSEIALTNASDKDLIDWFDGNAHNLKNVKLVIE